MYILTKRNESKKNKEILENAVGKKKTANSDVTNILVMNKLL